MSNSKVEKMNVVGNLDLEGVSVGERMLAYAYAYLNASRAVSNSMESNDELMTWPNANVALMTCAHAVELFIKGLLHLRNHAKVPQTHDLEQLAELYREVYPEERYEWDIPFEVDYSLLTDKERELVRGTVPIPSILYRYPVQGDGREWEGIFGFSPAEFGLMLGVLEGEFDRLQGLIVDEMQE